MAIERVRPVFIIGLISTLLSAIALGTFIEGMGMATALYIPGAYFVLSQPILLHSFYQYKKQQKEATRLYLERRALRYQREEAFDEWNDEFCIGASVIERPRKPDSRLMMIDHISEADVNARRVRVAYANNYLTYKKQTDLIVVYKEDLTNLMASEWLQDSKQLGSKEG